MTIRKGEPWGTEIARPADVAVAESDAELAAMVTSDPQAAISVAGGDVFRAVGRPSRRGRTAQRLPMDLIRVRWDDGEAVAVAHVLLRRRWLRGPIIVVANIGNLGDWDVAPRAHPNDGTADLVEIAPSMSIRTRLAVRRRLATGTHVPHPEITVSRRSAGELDLPAPAGIWIDGVLRGRTASMRFTVEPDAYHLIC